MDGLGREIASVISEVRAAAPTELMPDVCEITRVLRSPDGSGGTTEDEEVIATTACRLSPVRMGTEGLRAASVLTATGPYVVRLPLGTDIQADDTIAVNGRTFTVTGPPRQGGEWAIDTAVPVEERR